MADITHVAADAVTFGGVIREDVMNKIWDISNIPLPFTELCSKGTHTNKRVEWVTDELADAATDNAVIEGADITQSDGKFGSRLGNFTQIGVKNVIITDTSEAANSIGGQASLSYQVKERQKELRRDVEAQMLTHQASVVGDASAAASVSAGIGAQLETNVKVGSGGSAGGFNTSTGVFDAPTPGTKRALTETLIRDTLQDIYQAGGNTECLMARPVVIRLLSTFLFGSTARVATLTSEKNQSSGDTPMTAYGSVNVFVTDFGQAVALKDNRLQAVDATATSSMYFLDRSKLRQSFLRGYQVEPLAKSGLSEKRMMSVQYALMVLNEKSQGAILAIDEALAVTA
ncbi:DUF5309 family protein [uncultured Paraglaciecola sp.]|uniref:SU10 major capsid protein n=1 Tax=uncultured Paraglaciecola sp. TaxID=1765024 RepID=UPI00260DACF3|nr:DUF5309 family protein [uncultured Paraglaciecola sp.]